MLAVKVSERKGRERGGETRRAACVRVCWQPVIVFFAGGARVEKDTVVGENEITERNGWARLGLEHSFFVPS